MTTLLATRSTPGWITADDCRVERSCTVVDTTTQLADHPRCRLSRGTS